MTLMEMKARAAMQAGENIPATGEISEALSSYVNEGLFQLTAGKLTREVQITVEENGYGLANLPGFRGVVRLATTDGENVMCMVRAGRLISAYDGTFILTYRAEPTALTADGDSPELEESFHPALADYATWRLLSNGGTTQQARGQFFYARFQLALARWLRCAEALEGRRRLTNKFH